MLHFIYLFNKYRYRIFQTRYIPSVFFSSKCSLFHKSNVFGSCIIHILYRGCAKIKRNNSGAKRLTGPLCPTSIYGSPVTLPNFQMASRLKIFMASRSKNGVQIYFSFLSKAPANEPPPGSPTGPLWWGRPIYRAFCVSQKSHLLGSPVKEPSLKAPFMESLPERCPTIRALLHSSIKVPVIWTPPQNRFPWVEGAPMERDACIQKLS